MPDAEGADIAKDDLLIAVEWNMATYSTEQGESLHPITNGFGIPTFLVTGLDPLRRPTGNL